MPIQYDMFGKKQKNNMLRGTYVEPPFSILDTKTKSWQRRKRQWKSMGIKSEIGRNVKVNTNLKPFKGNSERFTKIQTSIFDPALCELLYHWFCPNNGSILDPFAGGSVRGIVANFMKYNYTGIDIRQEQIDSNREQGLTILEVNNQPQWYAGDSNEILNDFNVKFDFIFSCPPYANLEVYSDMEKDISNMTYDDFRKSYKSIIKKSCDLLKVGSYACFVVGEVRDKKGNYIGFVPDTINAFKDAGMTFYNEAILLDQLGNAAMRASCLFKKSKKLVKVHQNVLIFKKDK